MNMIRKKIMLNYIKDFFIYCLTKDYLFARVGFVCMHLILIWSICGLIFISKTNTDICLNALQLLLYILFMWSTYSRIKYNERINYFNELKNNFINNDKSER